MTGALGKVRYDPSHPMEITPDPQTSCQQGIFEGLGDVGKVLHPGSLNYDPLADSYALTGSGENMWAKNDEFFFVWKKVSGDISLTADIAFVGEGVHAHRKACLLVRQSLDTDSVYADAAIHGDGLAALQFRDERGASTHDIQSPIVAPKRLRIEKVGNTVTLSASQSDGEPLYTGAAINLEISDPYYIGIGVCSHDREVKESAIFSSLTIEEPSRSDRAVLHSTLEIVSIDSTDRRIVKIFPEHIEAPNWTPDGQTLIFNSGGRLYRIPCKGGEVDAIETGFATRCNNDHGISPDGSQLVISDQSVDPHQSVIYVLPITGGEPKRITESSPSYWHGWSPDGQTLVFCGQRNGKFGIFTIPASGGLETRLTQTDGLDDGPDYSPDGKKIYFNSDRTGQMQIWRMETDGSGMERVTSDGYNDWFAHVSPDGCWMVFLSYDSSVKGHPPDKDVMLRLMSLKTGEISVLAKLYGGQGTINVPSWSPDSRRLAFVSYQYR